MASCSRPDGVGYVLGPGLLGLAAAARAALPLRELARPPLERLAAATGESAQLYVRDGDRRICVDAVDSEQELRTIVDVGATLPLTKGSAGKVLLAWSVQDATADRLAAQLAAVRRRGWAESHGERETGVASISAPVLGPDGADPRRGLGLRAGEPARAGSGPPRGAGRHASGTRRGAGAGGDRSPGEG